MPTDSVSELQILVYSNIVDSVCFTLFDVCRSAGLLRRAVYNDCLRDMISSGSHVNQLVVYYMRDGVPYHPTKTISKRISEHIHLYPPRELDLLQSLADLAVSEDRVHFIIQLPGLERESMNKASTDAKGHGDIDNQENIENVDAESQGEDEDESQQEDDSQDEDESLDVEDEDGQDGGILPIEELPCHLSVELFCEPMARFIGGIQKVMPKQGRPLDELTSALTNRLSFSTPTSNSNLDIDTRSQLLSLLVQLVDPQAEGISVSPTYADSSYASLSCEIKDRMLPAPEHMPLVLIGVGSDADADEHSSLKIDHTFNIIMHTFYKQWSKDGDSKRVQECSSCPIFGVTLVGTCLRVYGSLFVDGWKSQQLTKPYDLAQDLGSLDRIFYALHGALAHLRTHYRKVLRCAMFKEPEYRLRPIPNMYIDVSGTEIQFSCGKSLDQRNAHVWRGHTAGIGAIVVKFTPRYGAVAHQLLAEHDYAPKLLYHGSPFAAHARCAVFKEISMVIMEWCGHEVCDLREGLRWGGPFVDSIYAAVQVLHDHNMVHGDLRGQNVFRDLRKPGTLRLRIIDFDWAGKEGEARYPDDLSANVRWPLGAVANGLITSEHDKSWLARYFPARSQ